MINLGTTAHRKRSIIITICPGGNRQTRCFKFNRTHPTPTLYRAIKRVPIVLETIELESDRIGLSWTVNPEQRKQS